jgi:hypothetical protein
MTGERAFSSRLKRSSLIFSIEEHEDGRILHLEERWSLIENGATLQGIREWAGWPVADSLLSPRA